MCTPSIIACENSHLSLLLATKDISSGGSFVFFGEQASPESEAYNPEVYEPVPMMGLLESQLKFTSQYGVIDMRDCPASVIKTLYHNCAMGGLTTSPSRGSLFRFKTQWINKQYCAHNVIIAK